MHSGVIAGHYQRAVVCGAVGDHVLVMFVGCIGPLILSFLLTRPRQPVVRYPEGEVYIG
ncbi:MAG: hypothetical protein ABJQ78_03885 [Alloalcanivorax sp.]